MYSSRPSYHLGLQREETDVPDQPGYMKGHNHRTLLCFLRDCLVLESAVYSVGRLYSIFVLSVRSCYFASAR